MNKEEPTCRVQRKLKKLVRIFTARKRSLGQGNMFTGVYLSTGGCLVLRGRGRGAWSWGFLVPGVPGSRWGCLVPGGLVLETPGTATAAGGTHPTGMHSCVRRCLHYDSRDVQIDCFH